ncbi:MAG: glycosyltransferase [Rectinemataceae bacterium]
MNSTAVSNIEKEYYRRLALQEEYGGTDKPVNRIEPLVSVVTITYQHAPYIRQCLDSILMQETDFPFELIIGEDGSTDGTREICIEYANRYPDKIRLFLRDRNLTQYYNEDGQVIRFNGHFSRAAARGKYIAICEGDDYWIDRFKLARQSMFLEKNNDTVLCHTNVLFTDSAGMRVWFDLKHYILKKYLGTIKSGSPVLLKNFIVTASVMYRNGLISFNTLKNFVIIWNMDQCMWSIMVSSGRFGYLDTITTVYRKGAGISSKIPSKRIHTDSLLIRKHFSPLFRKYRIVWLINILLSWYERMMLMLIK